VQDREALRSGGEELMAASQPTAGAAQPPPDLPNMPEVSNILSNYLRTFSLWCRNGFAASLRSGQALPGVLLLASDAPANAPKVFLIQVNSAGAITATAVGLGGPNPQGEARSP
jgi:hypothetical protein